MKLIILAIAAWVLTGLIAVLGVTAGATIWVYMEPVVDTVPKPASYFLAATVGFLALFLSLIVSVYVGPPAGPRGGHTRQRETLRAHWREPAVVSRRVALQDVVRGVSENAETDPR